MKAIVLHRPWADWVMLGWKSIETRTHSRFKSLQGQRIAIVAGKKIDMLWVSSALDWLTDEQIDRTIETLKLDLGGKIICTVKVGLFLTKVEKRDEPAALIECDTTRTGLVLSQIDRVEPPVPVLGRQGIFEVEL